MKKTIIGALALIALAIVTTGQIACRNGMSFSMSCSCSEIVCVEITTFLPAAACAIAGTRYAKLLPTPVPASAIRCVPRAKASSTAAAICCCCGRSSKPLSRLATGPVLAKKS